MATPKDAIESLSFEDALSQLEEIVKGLESGKVKLDEAVAAYEKGARLKRHCEQKLAEAKAKVERIGLGPGGQPATEPLDVG